MTKKYEKNKQGIKSGDLDCGGPMTKFSELEKIKLTHSGYISLSPESLRITNKIIRRYLSFCRANSLTDLNVAVQTMITGGVRVVGSTKGALIFNKGDYRKQNIKWTRCLFIDVHNSGCIDYEWISDDKEGKG